MAEGIDDKIVEKEFRYVKPSKGVKEKKTNLQDVRMVFIGRSGNGKSSSGNTILFEEGKGSYFNIATVSASHTAYNDTISIDVRGRNLTVVDTPGTQHYEWNEYDITKEIYSAVEQSEEGFDVLLVTFKYSSDGLSIEERKSLKQLEDIFAQNFFNHVIFIFTHGELFVNAQRARSAAGKEPLDFIQEITRDVYSFIKKEAVGPIMRKANNRMILFKNTERDPTEKIRMSDDLLKMIDELKIENRNNRYSRQDLPPFPPPPPLPIQWSLFKPWTWF